MEPVLLAHGLRRRKHRAWMGVVALLGLTVLGHLVALAGHFIPRGPGNGGGDGSDHGQPARSCARSHRLRARPPA